MARPRQFDRQQALDAAMQVFWMQGYSASSLQQLLDAMQINRGSLYAAFGDKAGLFTEVVNHYHDSMQAVVLEILNNQENPAQGIRDVFDITLFMLNKDERALGCLLVNTVNELSAIDTNLQQCASEKLDVIEQGLIETCRRAQAQEQMITTVSADEAGKMLMTCMIGLRVQSRRGVEELPLRQSVEPLLSMLMPNK
ncbi:HTH-type transcriptional repressor ComR [Zhongshania aliphaticivorans]|uniref:HTH-type transcriptional repressor ComR n=1 Tax=Zhongshania aliphaticivorans TaxID=1470434 RepID=A0A5S9PIK1_9GAMM|nr:TetR/AcrR family transcriptional regulator [Zhongshania aliphaticivorans]CAA0104014.1 HTH-type transcriptional repressor ComR [Zhongshania aliphaticivorans]CAA0104176.1 HTH-type transcriptional repressor ComR [Zhongshania aliphaticivorans]